MGTLCLAISASNGPVKSECSFSMVLDKEDKSCWLTGPLVADLSPVEDGDPGSEAGEDVVLSAQTEVRLPVLTGSGVHLARDALHPVLWRAAHRVRHPVTNPGGQIIAGLRGRQGRTPPLGPISFIFMHFSAKILRNNRFLFPKSGVVSPSWNGSTGKGKCDIRHHQWVSVLAHSNPIHLICLEVKRGIHLACLRRI